MLKSSSYNCFTCGKPKPLSEKCCPDCYAKQLTQFYVKKGERRASIFYDAQKWHFVLQISCVNTNWRGDKSFHIGQTYNHAVEWLDGFVSMCSVSNDGVKPYFRHKKVPRHGDKNDLLNQKLNRQVDRNET